MQKYILLLILISLAVYQIQADCDNDIEKVCRQRTTGTFPYDCDKSCKKFILCFQLSNEITGVVKNCPKNQYYDSSHRLCTTTKPANCL